MHENKRKRSCRKSVHWLSANYNTTFSQKNRETIASLLNHISHSNLLLALYSLFSYLPPKEGIAPLLYKFLGEVLKLSPLSIYVVRPNRFAIQSTDDRFFRQPLFRLFLKKMNGKVTAGKLVVGNSFLHFSVPSSIQKSSTANYCGTSRTAAISVTAVTNAAKNASKTTENWTSTSNKVRVRSTLQHNTYKIV